MGHITVVNQSSYSSMFQHYPISHDVHTTPILLLPPKVSKEYFKFVATFELLKPILMVCIPALFKTRGV